MNRDDLMDLNAFAMAADERNFTRAATRLGISQSALSHAIRRLETRLGIRLLTRTTRNVSLTEAGARLLSRLAPALTSIEEGLSAIDDLRATPSGTIRITATEHAFDTVLWPVMKDWLAAYPGIQLEVSVDQRLTDIVEERFDAGVRIGESLAKDMVAIRIGPDIRLIVVGAPDYLDRHGSPASPQDLASHTAINLRLRTAGGLYAWEFEKDGHEVRVRVDGRMVFDSNRLVMEAARAGFGLAMVLEDEAAPHLASGALQQVLADWTPPFAGYFLYYPSRRQQSAAFALLVKHLLATGTR
jgi:DNA-binding transcriptional LysR family regulator